MVLSKLPAAGQVLWQNVWQITTVLLLAVVIYFGKDTLAGFNESVESSAAALALDIAEGDKALSKELEESAARQAQALSQVGKDLAREIQVLRDRQAEDRAASAKLVEAVSDLQTRAAVREDRLDRE